MISLVSEIMVRPVADDDEADAAGRVVADAYFSDGFREEEYRSTLLDGRARARAATLLVAVERTERPAEAERVVGTVTYVVPGQPYAEVSRADEAEFRMLGVDPAGQGRGVGAALVQACIDRASGEGRTALVMCTEVKMRAAQRLYERMGFVRIPERDWAPLPVVQLLAYGLPLS
jgi:ribosomal protein S18 acetylase RimI-like enzyme